jgi:hypothetical protein
MGDTMVRFERLWLPSSWLSDDWLSSSVAAKSFFFCALCVVAGTAEYNLDTSKALGWQSFLWDAVGAIEALGILFLWMGMWRYWSRVDSSTRAKKRLWFTILLIGFWWGSVLYYFFAYLPQTVRARRAEA